jgi:hypothetical protein
MSLYNFPGARSEEAKALFSSLVPDSFCLYAPAEPMNVCPDRVGLYGAFGLSAVETSHDGTFQFADHGRQARIVGIHGPGSDEPIDLLAWYPWRPKTWWTLRGLVPLLGEYHASRSIYFQKPLIVRASPETWLRAGLDGCVLLEPRSVSFHLAGARRILVESPAVAERLREGFHSTVPEIRVINRTGRPDAV